MVQAQIRNGIVQSVWSGSDSHYPVPPDDSWTFLNITNRPELLRGESLLGALYSAATDTFSPAPVVPRTIVTKAQVVSVLTAQEWSEMNKYHPTAPAPYNDADIFHAISQFQLAQTINLADPAYAAIMSALVTKGLMSAERAQDIYDVLLVLANK